MSPHEITLRVHPLVETGRFAIRRKGELICGAMRDLPKHYRPGDVVLISRSTLEALEAFPARQALLGKQQKCPTNEDYS